MENSDHDFLFFLGESKLLSKLSCPREEICENKVLHLTLS